MGESENWHTRPNPASQDRYLPFFVSGGGCYEPDLSRNNKDDSDGS